MLFVPHSWFDWLVHGYAKPSSQFLLICMGSEHGVLFVYQQKSILGILLRKIT